MANIQFEKFLGMAKECSLCGRQVEHGELVMESVKCGHVFHPGELEDWFLQHNRHCVECNVDIATDQELEEYLLKL